MNTKYNLILIFAFFISTNSFGQNRTSKNEVLKNKIIALEKSRWKAWNNNNTDWFHYNATAECLWINAAGIHNKGQMITSVKNNCDVTHVAADNFKFVLIHKNMLLLTYTVFENAVCIGEKF